MENILKERRLRLRIMTAQSTEYGHIGPDNGLVPDDTKPWPQRASE